MNVPFEKWERLSGSVHLESHHYFLTACWYTNKLFVTVKKKRLSRGFLCHTQLHFWPDWDSMMKMKPSISKIRSRAFYEGQFSFLLIAITWGQIETITMGLHLCSLSRGQQRWRQWSQTAFWLCLGHIIWSQSLPRHRRREGSQWAAPHPSSQNQMENLPRLNPISDNYTQRGMGLVIKCWTFWKH